MSDLKQAVIIFRHAKDIDPPFKAGEEITFDDSISITKYDKNGNPTPYPNKVTVVNRRLSIEGLNRAQAIKDYLQSNLINNKYCSISKVITEHPGTQESGTSNPLETVKPLVEKLGKDRALKLLLLESNKYEPNKAVFNGNALLEEGHSTVISWEGTGMWWKDQDHKPAFDANSLLGSLAKNLDDLGKDRRSGGNGCHNPNEPQKGTTIYVFTNLDSSSGKFDLEMFTFDGVNFTPRSTDLKCDCCK